MKRILIAVMLVLVMAAGVLAAEVKISGEVEYGLSKTGDADAAWYAYPGLKLKFSNDNFEVRFRGQQYPKAVAYADPEEVDPIWWLSETDCALWGWNHHDHEYAWFYPTLDVPTEFGVRIDRLNVKLPVEGAGTFVAGRQYFGTGDWDFLGHTYDGLGWSGTFDKLTLKALWDVKNKEWGGRAAVGLGKVTVGGNYLKNDAEEKSYSVDARLDVSEKFDLYGEFGDDNGEDIRVAAAEAKLGGFDLYAGRDFELEESEIYAEKTVNNVLLHAGYVKADSKDDGTLEFFARYTF